MKKIANKVLTVVMVGLLLWAVLSFIEVNQKNMNINGENEPLSEWNLIAMMCESTK
jgi:uncharacterized protein with PQ loop repeat